MATGLGFGGVLARGSPYATAFLAEAIGSAAWRAISGGSARGAEVTTPLAAIGGAGDASTAFTAKVDRRWTSPTAARAKTANTTAGCHGARDCVARGCVSSCSGVKECSCTRPLVSFRVHEGTLIERAARCQDSPFCKALHCRAVRPFGRAALTR